MTYNEKIKGIYVKSFLFSGMTSLIAIGTTIKVSIKTLSGIGKSLISSSNRMLKNVSVG